MIWLLPLVAGCLVVVVIALALCKAAGKETPTP